MDITAYSYVIVVAALGMGIVFVFLWMLSGLMTLIRRVFSDGPGQTTRIESPSELDAGAPPLAYQGNNWIVASVVAYLEAEQLDQASDPGPWVSGRSHHEDPWMTATRRES